MRTFQIRLTGDYLSVNGQPVHGDIGLDTLDQVPNVKAEFLQDLKPSSSDPTYFDRFYSLQIEPNHIEGANGLVVLRPWVKASTFARGAEDLVVIGRCGAGYDKIDLEACTSNDVAVFNSPDTLTHSTASGALLFILALAKRLPQQDRLVRNYRWDLQGTAIGTDLPGKTLGVVGWGNTGQELTRLVAPFKMRVLAYSPHADPVRAMEMGVTLVPELDALLRESDFVSLHCRLTERTRGIIRERELRLMKPTAFLINVPRGELIQHEALCRCLREGWIAGAGLDVFDVEPLPANDPLIGLDNVILTPHSLPSTHEGTEATLRSVLNGMLRAAVGCLPANIVNREVLSSSRFQAKLARFAAGPDPR